MKNNKILIAVATKRLEICSTCNHFFKQTKTCTKCGCFMLLKTKVPLVECPEHKWGRMYEDNYGLPSNESLLND